MSKYSKSNITHFLDFLERFRAWRQITFKNLCCRCVPRMRSLSNGPRYMWKWSILPQGNDMSMWCALVKSSHNELHVTLQDVVVVVWMIASRQLQLIFADGGSTHGLMQFDVVWTVRQGWEKAVGPRAGSSRRLESRLVLGCIDASDSESRRIFQHFLRSTRFAFLCTSPNFKIS